MKKFLALGLTLIMLLAVVGCQKKEADVNEPATDAAVDTPADQAAGWRAGVCIYKFDDTFMTSVRDAMKARADELGAELEIVDSQNKQSEQSNQVDTFLTQDVQALCLNPVDRVAAQPLMEKAKENNLPVVFINRQPEDPVMAAYDKIWYVGAKAEQSGTLSGEIIVDYFKANPEADKNGDGKIQFVMLQGEPGHQDATLRTEYSQQALVDGGFEYEALAMDTAMWDTAKATDLMNTWITSIGLDKIEAVLANNDDMALGAIAALQSQGYNKGDPDKFIPVVGVDATTKALSAMEDGSLLGTVLNDGVNQGKAAVNIMNAAVAGQEITEDSIGYPITDGKWIWIEYVKVTKDNYQDFQK
ncbi:MAG: galactose ABC transporter substrate-binding protein [Eubacteriales bacterium]|nr:galactose ABC transporter substrate-binding protein [Eubacteriales bacterium]